MQTTQVEPAANVADFRFHVRGYEGDELRVTGFDGIEGLSELSEYRITLSSDDGGIDPDAVLGQDAMLELAGEHGTRVIHGIVSRFERTDGGSSLAHYEATLVPPHWMLTRRIQSRVFNAKRCERMDVIGIVTRVIADSGLSTDHLHAATTGQYEAREFVAQYRESDWDFISRLLESEGIYYYFDHAQGLCRMVLVDSKGAHPPFVEKGYEIPYRDPNGLVPEHEFVYSARLGGQMRIGAVALDDYTFRDPAQNLRQNASAGRFTGLTMVDTPGGFSDKSRGRRLTALRLEEQQCEARVLRLGATVRGLWPGGRMKLIEHPTEAFNGEYLIVSVAHRATQSQSAEEETTGDPGTRYEADVRVISRETQFRPPRVTPRPTVLGSQTAIVVGPPGEEIHTDEFGRVEVRFHWDQEGAHDVGASCWIRVSQGWAGGQYGMVFLPRVGQEVIVDFLEGDPDQPIITGRVFNKDHMPPYKLPARRTVSAIRTCSSPGAGGGNEIRFEDAKGSEQLLLFAEKDLHFRARGCEFETVGGDAHRTVCKNEYEHVKESKHSTVALDRMEDTKGNLHLRIEKDVKESVQGRKTSFVLKKYAILNSDGVVVESDTSITLKVKGNFIRIDGSGVTIVGSKVNINSGGSADTWEWDSPDLLTLPAEAATIEYGRNTTYATPPEKTDGVAAGSVPGKPRESSASEKKVYWIEIELVDDDGVPCPGELYEVIEPNGEKQRGRLNSKGLARVQVSDPGVCQISFPELDMAVWERAATGPATPDSTGADGGNPGGNPGANPGGGTSRPAPAAPPAGLADSPPPATPPGSE